MANRNFKRVQSLNNETKIITGHFTTDGAGGAQKVAGLGWSLQDLGSGEWVVTLEDEYPTVLAITVTGVGEIAYCDDNNILTDRTFTIISAGDFTGEVHFAVFLNNSGVA